VKLEVPTKFWAENQKGIRCLENLCTGASEMKLVYTTPEK
jgi:hypothetical protein